MSGRTRDPSDGITDHSSDDQEWELPPPAHESSILDGTGEDLVDLEIEPLDEDEEGPTLPSDEPAAAGAPVEDTRLAALREVLGGVPRPDFGEIFVRARPHINVRFGSLRDKLKDHNTSLDEHTQPEEALTPEYFDREMGLLRDSFGQLLLGIRLAFAKRRVLAIDKLRAVDDLATILPTDIEDRLRSGGELLSVETEHYLLAYQNAFLSPLERLGRRYLKPSLEVSSSLPPNPTLEALQALIARDYANFEGRLNRTIETMAEGMIATEVARAAEVKKEEEIIKAEEEENKRKETERAQQEALRMQKVERIKVLSAELYAAFENIVVETEEDRETDYERLLLGNKVHDLLISISALFGEDELDFNRLNHEILAIFDEYSEYRSDLVRNMLTQRDLQLRYASLKNNDYVRDVLLPQAQAEFAKAMFELDKEFLANILLVIRAYSRIASRGTEELETILSVVRNSVLGNMDAAFSKRLQAISVVSPVGVLARVEATVAGLTDGLLGLEEEVVDLADSIKDLKSTVRRSKDILNVPTRAIGKRTGGMPDPVAAAPSLRSILPEAEAASTSRLSREVHQPTRIASAVSAVKRGVSGVLRFVVVPVVASFATVELYSANQDPDVATESTETAARSVWGSYQGAFPTDSDDTRWVRALAQVTTDTPIPTDAEIPVGLGALALRCEDGNFIHVDDSEAPRLDLVVHAPESSFVETSVSVGDRTVSVESPWELTYQKVRGFEALNPQDYPAAVCRRFGDGVYLADLTPEGVTE